MVLDSVVYLDIGIVTFLKDDDSMTKKHPGFPREYHHWLIEWRRYNKRKYKIRLILNRNVTRACFGVAPVRMGNKKIVHPRKDWMKYETRFMARP